MKLAPNALVARLPAILPPQGKTRLFLLYGNDPSRLQATQSDLLDALRAKYKGLLQVSQHAAAKLSDGTLLLQDEINTTSLLGDIQLIKIEGIEDKHLPLMESLDLTRTEHFLLLIADSLTAKSKLRAWAESQPSAASLGCYAEEGANLQEAIRQQLQRAGFTFGRQEIDALADALSGDVMLLRNEVEKLEIYKGTDRTLTLEDIAASVSGYQQEEADAILSALLTRNSRALQQALITLEAEKQSTVALIRMLILSLQRLLAVTVAMENGMAMEQALQQSRPPFFFKQLNYIKPALRHWHARDFKQLLSALLDTEKQCKMYGHQEYALLQRTFLRFLPPKNAA